MGFYSKKNSQICFENWNISKGAYAFANKSEECSRAIVCRRCWRAFASIRRRSDVANQPPTVGTWVVLKGTPRAFESPRGRLFWFRVVRRMPMWKIFTFTRRSCRISVFSFATFGPTPYLEINFGRGLWAETVCCSNFIIILYRRFNVA